MSAAPRARVSRSLAGLAAGERVALTGEAAHHLGRVARVRAGDAVVVFDGEGREARARVAAFEPVRGHKGAVDVVLALEEAPRAGVGCDGARVVWLQGFPKGDKLDAVVRQATELGVAEVWPVYTERAVARPVGPAAAARTERLRAIAESAAAQCGRADVPVVRAPQDLAPALAALPARARLRLVPWEEGGAPLGAVLVRGSAGEGAALTASGTDETPEGCVVLVGPEGGLTADEVTLAQAHGFVAVGLGPRIWRTETVAPALLAVLSYARGDLRARG